MGEYNGTPLKWYPFAKLDASGNVTGKLSDSTFSYKDELTAGTYYFISEKVLKTNAMQFNSSCYTDDYSNHYSLDYIGTTIQTYISGQMLTDFSIADNIIYYAISKRTLLGETYTFINERGINEPDPSIHKTNDTPNQTLWLLNYTEVDYLESTENTPCSKFGYPQEDIEISEPGVFWWLRSPDQVLAVESISEVGVVTPGANAGCIPTYSNYGVRPAFQLTIA